MEMSDAFRQAKDLLANDPIKPGTARKLYELEKQVRPDELKRFGDLWEGYMAASGEQGFLEMQELNESDD